MRSEELKKELNADFDSARCFNRPLWFGKIEECEWWEAKIEKIKALDVFNIIERELSNDIEMYKSIEWNCMQLFGTDHHIPHMKEFKLKVNHHINKVIDKIINTPGFRGKTLKAKGYLGNFESMEKDLEIMGEE